MSFTIENNFAYGAFSEDAIVLESISAGTGEWSLENNTNLRVTVSSSDRKDFVINISYRENKGVDLFLPSLFKSMFDLKKDSFLSDNFKIVSLKIDSSKGNIANGSLFIIPSTISITENSRLGECKKTTYFKDYPQKDLYIEKIQGNVPFRMQNKERTSETKEVARIVEECGIFLRWRNTYGGWSYWLFSQDYTEDVKTKSLGSALIGRTYVGLKYNSFYPFGTTSKKTWTLTSEVPVLDYEFEEIKSLFVSPEIYIWKSKEVDDIQPQYWERVNIVEGSQKFKHNSQYTHPLSVTIEFQEPKTITQL
ncbi:hypothetical protein Coch_0901 [Capnocytophaga ochracea DSM 7271]|uniref:Uncharacterized protein n=1 Tax=Capnocytophaga ochracea (strain ATCC 27872 / DSM 7271 / CCUG 9716 / JCM 12966 / NCTC 12371 / SS31 / VPI 2845) TaxID=521097 RepID=C7M9B0_CAPOD|nr:hypothetical protein [Capnocytophaga ochracea]ACU92456.1 hypothetical protein Coch_0901 [Capnocytophaga ochracea DSM 7271]UAK51192.1 hypothetical protein K8O87_10650 [Capnocytophaga ochracea]